ncbi:hypothetical protein UY3_12685 [Chelonia mydas]|uniref:Uncharacterized protein n=1 Tax=Chelonia mydas TaxID=8469 RepID=M7BDF3_CHEMY|nr:hypothetical protein UY3_12685 [Chelonia mydas]
MQQCREKIKELRQPYHKAREANHRSSGAPKTFRFYEKLNAILSGDSISITNSPLDTLEAAEREGKLEAEILDEEVELEEDVELPAALPGGAGSQELFSTPEVLGGEQEADETLAAKTLRNTPRTPANQLRQIRKKLRHSKKDMFREVLQRDERQTRESEECWEADAAFASDRADDKSDGGSDRDAQVFDTAAD